MEVTYLNMSKIDDFSKKYKSNNEQSYEMFNNN